MLTVKDLRTVGVAWKMMLVLWMLTIALNFLSLYSTLSTSATTPAEYLLKWRTDNAAIFGLGVSALGIAITVTSFKERAKWAWLVMWCYPVIQFLLAFNVSLVPLSSPDYGAVTLGAVSIVALLLPMKQIFARTHELQSEPAEEDKHNLIPH